MPLMAAFIQLLRTLELVSLALAATRPVVCSADSYANVNLGNKLSGCSSRGKKLPGLVQSGVVNHHTSLAVCMKQNGN